MGCDIHGYIEYRRRDAVNWQDFGGRLNPGRNYSLFGRLARVRVDAELVAPIRGLPSDLASESRGDWWLYVNDNLAARDSEGCCSQAKAEKWHTTMGAAVERDESGTIIRVECPDWHTPSWVNADELAKAVEQAEALRYGGPEPEYRAVIAAMRALEATDMEVRFVFWFDN